MLAGQKHHDKIRRRTEFFPIGLVAEPLGVRAHRECVAPERGAARVLAIGLAGAEIVVERTFRIDDELAAAGQVDHRIGALAAILAGDARLQREINTLAQPRHLERVAQLLLAPAAAGLAARA